LGRRSARLVAASTQYCRRLLRVIAVAEPIGLVFQKARDKLFDEAGDDTKQHDERHRMHAVLFALAGMQRRQQPSGEQRHDGATGNRTDQQPQRTVGQLAGNADIERNRSTVAGR
jgi:hypothetical protein